MTMKLPILVVAYLLVNTTANNVKEDFIKKMDGAMQHKQSLADLQQRLLAVAVPRDLSDSSASSNDLDLSQYALKYVGCQNIKSFSDELAELSSANSSENDLMFWLSPNLSYSGFVKLISVQVTTNMDVRKTTENISLIWRHT